ncbi:SAM-dependent methyltransferase [Kitasatospora sp. NPDC049285]|uniref:SAM-dependent methyltransferase n=1 Tax=Kitasatospora sp. NPDC049285 TaxID=3157096 RepID=UPI00342E3EE6
MESGADGLSPVSRTALAVARVRAYESSRPEPLFRDPYALAFVAASGVPMDSTGPTTPLARRLVAQGILRTCYYDDRLLASGARQVVLLAAGLDTRAFRLAWPDGTRMYELDLPAVLAFKDRVLDQQGAKATCERTALAVDLVDPGWPDRLLAAGFDPEQPTAWLAEGLLVYLDAAEAAELLGSVGRLSAPGSRLLLERGRDVTGTPHEPELAHITELWRGGLGPGTGDWLDSHGWTTEFTALVDVAAQRGRPLPPRSGPETTGFLEARRG